MVMPLRLSLLLAFVFFTGCTQPEFEEEQTENKTKEVKKEVPDKGDNEQASESPKSTEPKQETEKPTVSEEPIPAVDIGIPESDFVDENGEFDFDRYLANLDKVLGPEPEKLNPKPLPGKPGQIHPVLKDKTLLKEFQVPTLVDLNRAVTWEPQRVVDPMEEFRVFRNQSTPIAAESEVLSLKNDSEENNRKIIDVLGRLPDSPDQVDYEATWTHHSAADIKSTNPLLVQLTTEFEFQSFMSSGFMGFDWNLEALADSSVVKEWHSSSDRMVDKIVLRDDWLWSDGTRVTAHDIVFSFQTIMNENVIIPAVRTGTDKMHWVEAYDDQTLVFFHKEPLATNVWNINFPIIPKHIYEKSMEEDPTLARSERHRKLDEAPISCGPYVLTRRTPGTEIVLTRRENYYIVNGKQVRDKPYFKQIRFLIIQDQNSAILALKKGDIDEMILTPDQWMNQTSDEEFYQLNRKVTGVEWTQFQFNYNIKSPIFSDKLVRQAFSYAFDYQELHEVQFNNLYQPAAGMFHRDAWMAPTPPCKPYQRDLDRTEQLLEEAGWIDTNGNGIRDKEINGALKEFEFTVLVPTIPERVKTAELLKASLDGLGIVCNVAPIEFTQLTDRVQKHQFEVAFGGWGTGTDPDTTENIWGTGEQRNYSQFSNEIVDKLYERGRREFNRSKRAKIYSAIHRIVYEEQPATWLYARNSFYAFNKDFRGYYISPRGPFNFGPGALSIWKVKK